MLTTLSQRLTALIPWLDGVVFGHAGLGISIFLILAVTLVIARSLRLRRWERILSAPASALAVQQGRWKSSLPQGIQFDTDLSLFDVLYGGHRAIPKVSAATHLKRELDRAEPETKRTLTLARSSIADEETISQLFSLRGFQQPGFLPVDAVASSLLGNLMHVIKGKKKFATGVEHAVLESLGAGGGFAGAKIGSIVGLGLIPLTTTAVPLVLPLSMLAGAWLGSVAGRRLGNRVKARQLHQAVKKLRFSSKMLKKSFLERFPELMKELDRDYRHRIAHVRGLGRWTEKRPLRMFFPGIMTAFYLGAARKLKRDWDEDRKQWKSIRKKVRTIRPLEFAFVLHGLGEESFHSDSTLLASYQQYEAAVNEVKEAQGLVA